LSKLVLASAVLLPLGLPGCQVLRGQKASLYPLTAQLGAVARRGKSNLFAGSEADGERAAASHSLIGTAKPKSRIKEKFVYLPIVI
jgi:hypothetical protein